MDDREALDTIEQLVQEESELLHAHEGQQLTAEEHTRLDAVRVRLDQCWDLLRQRRAQREFGKDPDAAQVRDADTVERYLQ